MDDRSCALLNLSNVKKQKICEKFSTLEALRLAIADGSIHQLDKGWGKEFVREVTNALAAFDKDNPLVSDAAAEKERDRQHLSAENDKNRKTEWRKTKLTVGGTIMAALIAGGWYLIKPDEKKDRAQLTETMFVKSAQAGEEKKSRVGLTEPVLRKEDSPSATDSVLEQSEFVPKWKKARADGPTALAEFTKAHQRGRVKNWTCTFMHVMTTSPTAKNQGIMVAFDDDETLIGTCFLPEGVSSSPYRDVDPGAPITIVLGMREMVTQDAAQFSDCQIRR